MGLNSCLTKDKNENIGGTPNNHFSNGCLMRDIINPCLSLPEHNSRRWWLRNMARPLRIEYPGAFYHVTARGNERRAIFRDDRDRERFLSYLETAVLRYEAGIHTY
jgi:hypothetical protein